VFARIMCEISETAVMVLKNSFRN